MNNLCVILLLSLFGVGELTDKEHHEFTGHLEEQIPGLLNHYDVPGIAVGLIKDGEKVWNNGYGYTDRDQSNPITSDTYFRAESMTKSITAWAIMILAEQGAIDLDDPVVKHLSRWEFPETEYDTSEVTIRRLLSHSAGMPFSIFEDVDMDDDTKSVKQILEEFTEYQAMTVRQPGSSFIYSNPGYVVLELLVEEVSGQPYPEFVDKNLLQPLQMHDSGFTLTSEIRDNSITGYLYNGKPVHLKSEPIHAHGGLLTTVRDFSKFVAAGVPGSDIGREILGHQAIHQMHTPEIQTEGFYALGTDYAGLGHFVEVTENDISYISHGGQGSGWLSYYYLIPETGHGIVMFSNSEQSWRLFGNLLEEWSAWIGISPPAISRSLSMFAAFLWSAVFIFGLLIFAVGIKLLRELISQNRRISFYAPFSFPFGLIKSGIAILLIFFVWQLSQVYMLAGMFPVISGWLIGMLLILIMIGYLNSLMVIKTE